MNKYLRILLAVTLDEKIDRLVLSKGIELAKQFHSEIYLAHSVEEVSNYGAAYGIGVGTDVEGILLENAKKAMLELGNKLGIPTSRQIVRVGSPKRVVLEEAEGLKIDLIVVGSHGYHGIRLLLGSTANAVLHGATCDVLAVRLKEE